MCNPRLVPFFRRGNLALFPSFHSLPTAFLLIVGLLACLFVCLLDCLFASSLYLSAALVTLTPSMIQAEESHTMAHERNYE